MINLSSVKDIGNMDFYTKRRFSFGVIYFFMFCSGIEYGKKLQAKHDLSAIY